MLAFLFTTGRELGFDPTSAQGFWGQPCRLVLQHSFSHAPLMVHLVHGNGDVYNICFLRWVANILNRDIARVWEVRFCKTLHSRPSR
jgi:hypothetical protein